MLEICSQARFIRPASTTALVAKPYFTNVVGRFVPTSVLVSDPDWTGNRAKACTVVSAACTRLSFSQLRIRLDVSMLAMRHGKLSESGLSAIPSQPFVALAASPPT